MVLSFNLERDHHKDCITISSLLPAGTIVQDLGKPFVSHASVILFGANVGAYHTQMQAFGTLTPHPIQKGVHELSAHATALEGGKNVDV